MTLKASLESIIERLTADRIYLAKHPAVVELQHADDTLDLTPDNAKLRGRGISNVPIRHGLPGVRVKVKQGSRCLLGYEGGDPDKPYASLWDAASVEQILFNGGTAGIARIGDIVQCYWPAMIDVLSGNLAGAPFAATLMITSPAVGIIQTGSARVNVGD